MGLRWLAGGKGRAARVTVVEESEQAEYWDGSRRDGHTAAATTRDSRYLGTVATVMDAEMPGIAMGWARGKRVTTDSQGAIGRILELR